MSSAFNPATSHPHPSHHAADGFRKLLSPAHAVLAQPRIWLRRHWHRRELADLDAAQLLDVGLDPLLVRRECTKPFWRA